MVSTTFNSLVGLFHWLKKKREWKKKHISFRYIGLTLPEAFSTSLCASCYFPSRRCVRLQHYLTKSAESMSTNVNFWILLVAAEFAGNFQLGFGFKKSKMKFRRNIELWFYVSRIFSISFNMKVLSRALFVTNDESCQIKMCTKRWINSRKKGKNTLEFNKKKLIEFHNNPTVARTPTLNIFGRSSPNPCGHVLISWHITS